MELSEDPGPVDKSVLYDQDNHVSSAVWDGQERGVLRCHEHTSMLDQWKLTPKQCWSYSRLNVGHPKVNQEPESSCFPFVLKWKGKSGSRAKCNVLSYRKALDSLDPCNVQWLPYRGMDCSAIPEDIRASLSLRASRTMLLCFDKAERHLPDRCLRQFGMHQTIPTEVQRWERKSRIVDHGVDLLGKMDLALKEWSERWLYIVESDETVDEGEYMHWYQKITRRYIGRVTSSLESEYQRTVTAMREIANIADIVCSDGLDSYNRVLVDEVRNIVHKCLTEQFEDMPKDKIRKKASRKRRQKDHLTIDYE
ncbi:protein MAIN-LIKE 2-like [Senna tora]|uniref:Protein MAIN-LIKE 2-like n=1 Tax=Senna tora TaxID=362788 RepID=A0A834XFA9_9FABA|nr:protein MAIN-LIKE 2-like [Senna tora]